MKLSNAIKTLTKKGYEVKENTYNFEAYKKDCRVIEFVQNGREDDVASFKVSNSYPSTLKRAIVLAETLGK